MRRTKSLYRPSLRKLPQGTLWAAGTSPWTHLSSFTWGMLAESAKSSWIGPKAVEAHSLWCAAQTFGILVAYERSSYNTIGQRSNLDRSIYLPSEKSLSCIWVIPAVAYYWSITCWFLAFWEFRLPALRFIPVLAPEIVFEYDPCTKPPLLYPITLPELFSWDPMLWGTFGC